MLTTISFSLILLCCYIAIQEESIFRKTKDGRIFEWKVEKDAPLCTLEEVFRNVDQSLGLNIELKFDDQIVYKEEELSRILQAILKVMLVSAFSWWGLGRFDLCIMIFRLRISKEFLVF